MKTKEKKPRTRRATAKTNKSEGEALPGYPLYSSDQDIMNQGERVNVDVENVKAQDANKMTRVDEIPQASIDDEPDTTSTSDQFAVTEEDLEALGPADLSMDGGDDED